MPFSCPLPTDQERLEGVDTDSILAVWPEDDFRKIIEALCESCHVSNASIPELLSWLDSDFKKSPEKVLAAVQELGVRGNESSIPHLAGKLKHESYRVRQEAFIAICMIMHASGSRVLIQKIIDGTRVDEDAPMIPAIAVAALKKLGMKQAEALTDPEKVRALLGNMVFFATDPEDRSPFKLEDAEGVLLGHTQLRAA